MCTEVKQVVKFKYAIMCCLKPWLMEIYHHTLGKYIYSHQNSSRVGLAWPKKCHQFVVTMP